MQLYSGRHSFRVNWTTDSSEHYVNSLEVYHACSQAAELTTSYYTKKRNAERQIIYPRTNKLES